MRPVDPAFDRPADRHRPSPPPADRHRPPPSRCSQPPIRALAARLTGGLALALSCVHRNQSLDPSMLALDVLPIRGDYPGGCIPALPWTLLPRTTDLSGPYHVRSAELSVSRYEDCFEAFPQLPHLGALDLSGVVPAFSENFPAPAPGLRRLSCRLHCWNPVVPQLPLKIVPPRSPALRTMCVELVVRVQTSEDLSALPLADEACREDLVGYLASMPALREVRFSATSETMLVPLPGAARAARTWLASRLPQLLVVCTDSHFDHRL